MLTTKSPQPPEENIFPISFISKINTHIPGYYKEYSSDANSFLALHLIHLGLDMEEAYRLVCGERNIEKKIFYNSEDFYIVYGNEYYLHYVLNTNRSKKKWKLESCPVEGNQLALGEKNGYICKAEDETLSSILEILKGNN